MSKTGVGGETIIVGYGEPTSSLPTSFLRWLEPLYRESTFGIRLYLLRPKGAAWNSLSWPSYLKERTTPCSK